jgi:arylsulfatase A-like enzyme
MGWHGGHLFDELLRVPLIVKFPQSRFAGRVVEAPVPLIDVAPTILAALGLDPPASFAGSDLLPALEAGRPPEGSVFAVLDGWRKEPRFALREGRWKLHRERELALFDLVHDPGEREDLAARRGDVVRALLARAEALIAEGEPQAPVPVEPDAATLSRLRELGYLE